MPNNAACKFWFRPAAKLGQFAAEHEHCEHSLRASDNP